MDPNPKEPATNSGLSASQRPRGFSLVGVVALGALSLATWVVVDRMAAATDAAGAGTTVELHGIPGIVWYCVPLGLAAWIIQRIARPAVTYRRALALVLFAAPLLIIAAHLSADHRSGLLPSSQAGVSLWILGTGLLLLTTGLGTGKMQWGAVTLALSAAATFFWIDDRIWANASLWYPAEDTRAATDGHLRLNAERLLFAQQFEIDRAIDAMARRENQANAFFVGFAGYAEEQVFAEEIAFAARTFAARYATRGRELLLLNDQRAAHPAPMASVTGLEYALRRLARQMNLDNDLLILALSSHGSSASTLSVSHGLLPLRDLDASTLRGALDAAGIQWRLLVVSACYAGAFIPELASPRTAIITAAAPDRTSFGCSNDRELTYFGEAFYRDALPHARTVREAFDRARHTVAQREAQEGIPPSDPRAFFGTEIEAKLGELRALENLP